MSAVQLALNFSIRKTRSASKREATSTIDSQYKVPVLRTPRQIRHSSTSSSTGLDPSKSTHCSSPNKRKENCIDEVPKPTCSPAKRSFKDRTYASPRKSPRTKEYGVVFCPQNIKNSPTKLEKKLVPVCLFTPDHSLKSAHCSPSKKHKENSFNETPTTPLCSPTKRSFKDWTNASPQISPRKSPRNKENGLFYGQSSGNLPTKLVPVSLFASDCVDSLKSTHCSPPKKHKENCFDDALTYPLCSPIKRSFKDRNASSRISPRKSPQNKENGAVSSDKSSVISPMKLEIKLVPVRLFAPDLTAYQEAKWAFLTSSTSTLHCREAEITVIAEFLESHLIKEKPGSLYISGAPGTGKTASLTQILQAVKFQKISHKCVFINCTNLKQPQSIYERIFADLTSGTESSRKHSSASDFQKRVTQMLSKSDKTILLILDEIDYLESKDQSILYTIFEWPALENSKLVLIGIANALDLTDRMLPRLQVQTRYKPKLLHFPPYTKKQITTILEERLKEISSEAQSLVKPNALQFCARKVASVKGDIRTALDVIRRALELNEGEVRKQQILLPRTQKTASSPSKLSKPKLVKCVDLPSIASILNDVYGNQLANGGQQDGNALPLQQKILLCALFLIVSNGKAKEVTLGKLHEVDSRICKKQQVTQVDQSEFTNLCNLVEARGLIAIKKNKNSRLSKVTLSVNESELQFALQDKCLLASILTDLSCLSSSV